MDGVEDATMLMKRREFIQHMAATPLALTPALVTGPQLLGQLASPNSDAAESVLLALDPGDFPSVDGAVQTVEPGQTHPQNPVLRPRPGQWDGTRCKVYGTVLFDPEDKMFKMWYSGGTDTPDAVRRHDGSPRHVGYAYSEDGIHWEQPILGVVEFNGSRDNNLIHLNAQAPSVFIQTHESDPKRRFLMLTEAGLDTARNKVLYSHDGIRWVQSEKEPIISRVSGRTHEPFSILYDPDDPDPSRRWKGYSLLHVSRNGYRGRAVGLFLGSEPERWTEYPSQPIMSALDGMESEIHLPHVSRFHGRYVMFYDAMEPNHHTQTEIALSYDGIRFTRIQNGVKVIPNGKPGQPDAGKVCVSPRSLFVHEGKIWWYYTMSTDTYQTGPRGLRAAPWYRYVGLAQWRLDGFASLRLAPGADQARVMTREIKIGGRGLGRVWLNADIPPVDGGTRVELLDAAGNMLATSKPWSGNHLRRPVEWQESPPDLARGKEIVLRLHFAGPASRVFSIGVQGSETRSPLPATVAARTATAKRDGRELWRFKADGKLSASPVLKDGALYFGSWDQNLYALDSRSGDLRWKFETGNAVATAPAVHGKLVYTASRDGQIYALETDSGKVKWKVPVSSGRNTFSPNGSWIDSSPAIGAFTVGSSSASEAPRRLFVGCHNRDLHAFNLNDGTEEWRFPTFNWILSHPAVAHYKVYFGSLDGRVYAVDARCGALAWVYTVGKHLRYSPAVLPGSVVCEGVAGSPLVVDETLYCGADDGFLYALDAGTGKERWIFQTEKWIWGRPLLLDGVLVAASAEGRIYGLEAATGKRLWVRSTDNANYGDIVASGKLALVACTSGHLYAVDPGTGEVAWTFKADAGLRAAPGAGPDGTIYLPTCSGLLHALKS
jgi:outer membrane protein assembly factor BamB